MWEMLEEFLVGVPEWNECETCPLTLKEERRLRVFENIMLRRIFGPKRDEATRERREHCIMRNLMICTRHLLLSG
jgi:hypothetical protein